MLFSKSMLHLLRRTLRLTVLHREYEPYSNAVLDYDCNCEDCCCIVFCVCLKTSQLKEKNALIFFVTKEVVCLVYIHNNGTELISFCITDHKFMALKLCKAQWLLHVPTTSFNIQKSYMLPTQCNYVFCMDLRTNSSCFPIQN
jgi:hypothetical protein